MGNQIPEIRNNCGKTLIQYPNRLLKELPDELKMIGLTRRMKRKIEEHNIIYLTSTTMR